MKQELTDIIRWINAQGWSPATSTNYSVRHPHQKDAMYISKSGVDKSLFTEHDLLEMTIYGDKLPGSEHIKSSAETGIHLSLYQHTSATAILHTHSVADTVLSRICASQKELVLRDYEVLKGFEGITTHETALTVPIFPNDQDIEAFSDRLATYIRQHSAPFYGFLIESHGLYTWGTSLAQAKRHLEVFQFLFLCELEQRKLTR